MGTEGIGLYLRKQWARWFTIIATSSLIPIEVYEIARRPRLARVAVLILNVAVVAYLWRRDDLLEKSAALEAGAARHGSEQGDHDLGLHP
jgi:uncharacterized membrane protein (DUF2068 family)